MLGARDMAAAASTAEPRAQAALAHLLNLAACVQAEREKALTLMARGRPVVRSRRLHCSVQPLTAEHVGVLASPGTQKHHQPRFCV
jgi:hypothetical protein